MNSNDPIQTVDLIDLAENQRLSIWRNTNMAYLFVGPTPKAQLAVHILDMNKFSDEELTELMKESFPLAQVSFQK